MAGDYGKRWQADDDFHSERNRRPCLFGPKRRPTLVERQYFHLSYGGRHQNHHARLENDSKCPDACADGVSSDTVGPNSRQSDTIGRRRMERNLCWPMRLRKVNSIGLENLVKRSQSPEAASLQLARTLFATKSDAGWQKGLDFEREESVSVLAGERRVCRQFA